MSKTGLGNAVRKTGATTDEVREFAVAAARVAHDNKCADVVVLDLRGLSNLADYFVLGTGTSDRQMHATLERIRDVARAVDRKPYNTADSTDGTWLLADYVDVVVHLFDEEHRAYYDLDGLWGDAPTVSWEAANGRDAGTVTD